MYYKKICPICLKPFFCIKISTLYCSKKCNNRTRSLPEKLLKSLIENVAPYAMQATKYHAMISEGQGKTSIIGQPITEQDLNDLETIARVKKYEQEEKEKQKSLESQSGFNITDEMIQTQEEINNNINIRNDNIVLETPKKYKIKSLQRNRGYSCLKS